MTRPDTPLGEATPDPGEPVLPAAGRPPVSAPSVGYVGALLALLLLGVGAVALRDAAVGFGWLRGRPWTTTVISGFDGLTHQGWMPPVGVAALVIGVWWMLAALRPRRRTALAVPARTSVWIGRADLARVASSAVDAVPGVLTSKASASLRSVRVTADVTAAGDPTLVAAITSAVADATGAFTITMPRIKVRTRTREV